MQSPERDTPNVVSLSGDCIRPRCSAIRGTANRSAYVVSLSGDCIRPRCSAIRGTAAGAARGRA